MRELVRELQARGHLAELVSVPFKWYPKEEILPHAAAWRLLDLLTFLTTGEDETRAWEVRRGATAPQAAGRIHSDLQRGFIRAEVIAYDDVVAAGGWDSARSKGLLRTESKSYVVQEGDVVHIRFNV